jgi:hypothetical protein
VLCTAGGVIRPHADVEKEREQRKETYEREIKQHVYSSLSVESVNHSVVFFYHNKSPNNIFSHDFSAKRTCLNMWASLPCVVHVKDIIL